MTTTELVLGEPQHMMHDPNDGTQSLEHYMALTRGDPTRNEFITLPVFGRVPVRRTEPALSDEVGVKATLLNYWIERGANDSVLHAEFIGDLENGAVRRFSRPFKETYRVDLTRRELARLYEDSFEPLKFHEVIFSARRKKVYDSIEGIQTPDGKSWVLL